MARARFSSARRVPGRQARLHPTGGLFPICGRGYQEKEKEWVVQSYCFRVPDMAISAITPC